MAEEDFHSFHELIALTIVDSDQFHSPWLCYLAIASIFQLYGSPSFVRSLGGLIGEKSLSASIRFGSIFIYELRWNHKRREDAWTDASPARRRWEARAQFKKDLTAFQCFNLYASMINTIEYAKSSFENDITFSITREFERTRMLEWKTVNLYVPRRWMTFWANG